jgi:hypothetical protein
MYATAHPWLDDQEGPISREDFKKYKELVNAEFKKIRIDKLEMLNSAAEEKDKLKEQHAEVVKIMKYDQFATEQDLEADLERYRNLASELRHRKDLLDHLKDKERAERLDRRKTPLNEPSFTAGDVGKKKKKKKKKERPPPLWDNPYDVAIELKVEQLLQRTQIALKSKDLSAAEKFNWAAFQEAQKLDYMPLEGRCVFWRGRIAYAGKFFEVADIAFGAAKHGLNYYKECLYANDWLLCTRSKAKKQEQRKRKQAENPDVPIEETDSEDENVPNLPVPTLRTGSTIPILSRSSMRPGAIKTENLGDLLGNLGSGGMRTSGSPYGTSTPLGLRTAGSGASTPAFRTGPPAWLPASAALSSPDGWRNFEGYREPPSKDLEDSSDSESVEKKSPESA